MEVKLRKSFEKQLKKLAPTTRNRFFERVDLLIENKFNPILNNHPVDAAFPGHRSINITGDYRAIFYEDGDTVVFAKIGRHSQLYS